MADENVPEASFLEFEISLGDFAVADFAVLSFEAHEAISQPFSLEATLMARADLTVDPADLIGQKAMLVAHLADQTDRYFNGVISQVKSWQEGTDDADRRWLVRIVPAFSTLGQKRRSRIFQELSVTEIVTNVLEEGGLLLRWATTADYPSLDYCVQYDETDQDFVSRLLEDAGIFYFFEYEQDAHTMVFGDDPSVWTPIPGDARLVFREPSGMPVEVEYVDSFLAQAEIRPAVVTLRDFNYLTPRVDLTSKANDSAAAEELELYEYPGGYDDGDAGDKLAQIRLEEIRVGASTAQGSGYSRRFSPGATFELDEHPLTAFNAKYHLISVDHRGNQEAVVISGATERERYRNEFVVQREELPFRPERVTESPVIAGPQTAIVVGPSNEEIYCDEHGRVKVQFHWDREGQNDDKSSCWMRVSQAWAGAGWGALYLPRVGQEVVVEFLEGDPDQPIVTGAVYNGVNPPPISLPADKTQSTMRSSSSPGGEGSNELRFEDAAGSEEVFLHAQKDLRIVVKNDKTQTVGGNESLTVSVDRSRDVGGNQTLLVSGNDSTTVSGSQSLNVGGTRSTVVGGSHSEAVSGSQSISVGGTRSVTVGGASVEAVAAAKTLVVGAVYNVVVGAAMVEVVGGLKTEEVGAAKTEVVGGDRNQSVAGAGNLSVVGDLTERVGGARNLLVKGDSVVNVGGTFGQKVKEAYTFKAKEITFDIDETFTIKVGSAQIQMTKDGDIVIKGDSITVKSDGVVSLKGSKVGLN